MLALRGYVPTVRFMEQPRSDDTAVQLTPAGRVAAALFAVALLAVLILGAQQGLRSGQSLAEGLGPIATGTVVSVAVITRRRRQRR